MSKKLLTISEALALLNTYDKLDYIRDLKNEFKARNNTLAESVTDDFDYDYSDFFDNDLNSIINKAKDNDLNEDTTEVRLPEIGDIFWAKIKLNHPKPSKCMYDSYEKRPVLIINIKANSVDGLEILHVRNKNKQSLPFLVNIGHVVKNDLEDSYVNLSNSTQYENLLTIYTFPYFDKDTKKPLTKNDVSLKLLGSGKIYKDDEGGNEPYLFTWDYKDNYIKTLDPKLYNKILEKLINYLEASSNKEES